MAAISGKEKKRWTNFESNDSEWEEDEWDEEGEDLLADREDEEDVSSYEEAYMEEVEALINQQTRLERQLQSGAEAGTEEELR